MRRMPPLLTRARWRGLALVTLAVLAQGIAAGAAAFALRRAFAALHEGAALPALPLALLAGSGLVIALGRIAAARIGEGLGQAYALDLRQALFAHAARMSASEVALRRSGYMSLRFVGDMSALRDWLGQGVPHLIAALGLIPIALGVLFALHPGFGLAVLPLFALGLAGIGLGGLRLSELHRTLRHRRARIAADMAERMPLAPHLGRLGRRRVEAAQIAKRSASMIEAALALVGRRESLRALPDLISGLAALVILWIGHRDGLATGSVAAALAALGIALGPMRDLANVWNLRAAFRAAHTKCALALTRAQRPAPGKPRRRGKPIKVEVRGLSLGKMENFSLSLPAGAETCLEDWRCADQTALISGLMGLEIPRAGEILLDGKAAARADQGSVAVIDAAPVVLRGSLRRALTMGLSPRPEDAQIMAAAELAGFAPAMARMEGLDGQIAEGARNLSLRERAALSLTRAMLMQPGLILISRSAHLLDSETQARMMGWARQSKASLILGQPASEQLRPIAV